MYSKATSVAGATLVLMSALAACTSRGPVADSGSPSPATVNYAKAICSSLNGVLTKVEHDVTRQERLVATGHNSTPSLPVGTIAKVWLPSGTYGKDLRVLEVAVRPYANASGNTASQVSNDAGALHSDLGAWFSGSSPGAVEHLPDNWRTDFSRFQAVLWTLASDCGVQEGTKRGVPLLAPASSSQPSSPSPSPSPSPSQPISSPPQPSPTPAAPSTSGSGAWCTAAASVYYAPDDENNVYVHSNQPYTDAIASGGGHSWSYETNGSGYAVIYLNGPSAGTPITVKVGAATCTATWT
jgi:hypothetical protein